MTFPTGTKTIFPLSSFGRSGQLRILIYRIGQLGDTLISLPSFHVIREHFPSARIILLSDQSGRDSQVSAESLLRDTGLVDNFISYLPMQNRAIARPRVFLRYYYLWRQLAALRLDCVIYLLPSSRSRLRTLRDQLFFLSMGIPKLIGFTAFNHNRIKAGVSEADLLLARVESGEIPVPKVGEGNRSLPITSNDQTSFKHWADKVGLAAVGKYIAIGPGSKMPAKIWPLERYIEVVRHLNQTYGFVPVVFGSPEEKHLGETIISACGCGFNAAGELSVKASIAALRECMLYLGNDTGTMHLAASVGLPCVAVFSHRSLGELWFPYGVPSRVIREDVPCKGCELNVCFDQKMRCMMGISVERAIAACNSLIESESLN